MAAVQPVPDWKTAFGVSNDEIFANAPLIKNWYAKADNPIDNPYQLNELNDRMRQQMSFIKGQLVGLDNATMIKVIDGLKAYYKKVSEKKQKSDIIFIELLIRTEELLKELNPAYVLKYNIDLDKDFTKFMPQLAEHFKSTHLIQLNFQDFLNKSFLIKFTEIVTDNEIENLDKESVNEQEKGGNVFKFKYESHVEYLYIQIIIKMLESPALEDTDTISKWLQNYPFRMLNKNGLFTPDNFYLSADKYIQTSEVIDDEDRKALYLAFFQKLKSVRTIPGTTIDSAIDFLDLYDESSLPEGQTTNMRSIYFREDFDYLNSLNVHGQNLNRDFWLALDKQLETKKKRLGPYIKAINSVSTLDEFFKTVTADLSLKGNVFIDKLKYEIYKQQHLCSQLPEEEETKDNEEMVHQEEKTPINLSNAEYEQLYNKGAKPIFEVINKMEPSDGSSGYVINMSGSKTNLVKKIKIDGSTKPIKVVNEVEANEHNRMAEQAMYIQKELEIASDVDANRYTDKMYIAVFNPIYGFQERRMRLFLQLEKPQEPEQDVNMGSADETVIDALVYLQHEESNFDNSLRELEDSLGFKKEEEDGMRGGGGKKEPEKLFHSVEFIQIMQGKYTTIKFDINNMSKKDILEFIKKMVLEERCTYYKIEYSIGTVDEDTDHTFKKLDLSGHEKKMASLEAREELLSKKISEFNLSLEAKRNQDYARLNKLREEQIEDIRKGAELVADRIKEINDLTAKLEAQYKEIKLAGEERAAEAQAELDAAIEKEASAKERLEKTKELVGAEKAAYEATIEADVEAEEEQRLEALSQKKKNIGKVGGIKRGITTDATKISNEIIAVIDVKILEATERRARLETAYKDDDAAKSVRLGIFDTALEYMKKVKTFLEEAIKAEVGITDSNSLLRDRANALRPKPKASAGEVDEWTIDKAYANIFEAAAKQFKKEDILKMSWDPVKNKFVPKPKDDTLAPVEKAGKEQKTWYQKILSKKAFYLDDIKENQKPTEFTDEDKKRLTPVTKLKAAVKFVMASKCKAEGFAETEQGWCYKKAQDEKKLIEEPEQAKEASKSEPVADPPRTSGRERKPKKQFGE